MTTEPTAVATPAPEAAASGTTIIPAAAPAPAPAPTPEAAPAPAPAVPSDDWRADLPDDLKEHATRFTTKADLVKGHLTLRQQLSKAIIPPGKDAKPEEVANYRKALGVPETPEGYKFADPPEGQPLTDEMKASRADLAKFFHDNNYSAAQAEQGLAKYNALRSAEQAATIAADKRRGEQSTQKLREEWGSDYEPNMTIQRRCAEKLAAEEGIPFEELRHMEAKDGSLLFDNPLLARFLAKMGREMGLAEPGLGPTSESARDTAEAALRENRAAQDRAKANRDDKERNRLYMEEQKIISRMLGNRPIVGSAGRAA